MFPYQNPYDIHEPQYTDTSVYEIEKVKFLSYILYLNDTFLSFYYN